MNAGERTRVATRHGDIALAAGQNRDGLEGMVFIPFRFEEATVFSDSQLDPFGKIPEFKSVPAGLSRR